MSSADLDPSTHLDSPTPHIPTARRSTARRVVLLLVAFALIVGLPGAAAAAYAFRPNRHSIALPPMPTPSPKPTIPTSVGDTTALRMLVVRDGVAAALTKLAGALLAQDQATYLQVATSPGATAMLRRQYRNLTAMRVSVYRVNAGALLGGDKPGQWKVALNIDVCFVRPDCAPVRVVEPSVWQDTADGPQLIALSPSKTGSHWYENTHPWELADLYVAIGPRTMVAATAALRGRLPAALAAAEKGAAKADQYAVGDRKPDQYRVYLASKGEWKTWFGGQRAKWAIGYSLSTGPYSADVVLNSAEISASYLPGVMRHELTHTASAYGTYYWSNNWWLIEGYAEAAEHGLTWDATSVTRRFADSGWNGRLPGNSPADNASVAAANGRYGVAFLAVYRLEQRFGRAALIDFFNRVVRGGRSFAEASPLSFHSGWAAVEADLIRFIKRY
ncbi:MAG: hypothetical protein HOV78_01860 [Hamadaea sp.]|nr:hypothetical protein [Hamadaea sp.]